METGKFCVLFKNHLETDSGSVGQYVRHLYGTMTMLTRSIHWPLLLSALIQSVTSYYVFQWLIVILSSLACLCLLNDVFRFTDQTFVRIFQLIHAWNIPCPSYSVYLHMSVMWIECWSLWSSSWCSGVQFSVNFFRPRYSNNLPITASSVFFPHGEMPSFITTYEKGNNLFKLDFTFWMQGRMIKRRSD